MKSTTTSIGVLAAAFLLALPSDAKETTVKLESLPEAVQSAAKAAAGQGEIKSITSETDDGKTTYEVAVVAGKQKVEHKFSADGKLLESEEAVALADLPDPARIRIQKLAGDKKILEVVTVTAEGKKFYEADIKIDKGVEEVKVSATGELLGSAIEDAAPAKDADGDNDGDVDEEKGK